MVKASKGPFNRKTRKLKGRSVATVAQLVRTFKVGDKVLIDPKAVFIGLPHLRYKNKHGVIIEKRGKSYMVEVADYNSKKSIICGPVHLKLSS